MGKKVWATVLSLTLLLSLLSAGLFALPVSAYSDGDYTYSIYKGEARITGYVGSGGDVEIPATLGGYAVTAITGTAFANCADFVSVTIPEGVTTIGSGAFRNCVNLVSLTIPASLVSIGSSAFSGCDRLAKVYLADIQAWCSVDFANQSANPLCGAALYLRGVLVTKLVIPDGVTAVSPWAFARCRGLKAVIIPDSVKTIGKSAFAHCDDLVSLTIADGLLSVGRSAFSDCEKLSSVALPNSVTFVDESAFYNCAGLKSVTLSENLVSLSEDTFRNCAALTTVTVPGSVAYIGERAFGGCASLTSLVIREGTTAIGKQAFDECDGLMSVTIPKSVTYVADDVFTKSQPLGTVHYVGNKREWRMVALGTGNAFLTNATWHYYANPCDIICDECDALRTVDHVWCEGVCDHCGVASPTKVIITTQPKTGYAPLGEKATVKVTAKGENLTYAWYVKNAGATKYTRSSIVSATYSATMSEKVKNRLVYCVVTDKYGNTAKSETVRLRMTATIIAESDTTAYAPLGEKLSASVTAVGDGLTYTWYIKNKGQTKYSKSSVTAATYTTTMSKTAKNRRLYCVVADKYGNTVESKTFILREAVSIVTQPVSTKVAYGEKVSVTVKASGDGLRYVWYIKNEGQTKYVLSSATAATYTTKMSDTANGRRLICYVYDMYGNKVQTETVVVKMK